MAGTVEVQLPPAQGQRSLLERASYSPVCPSCCDNCPLLHQADAALGGPQCSAQRTHVRHHHSTHH